MMAINAAYGSLVSLLPKQRAFLEYLYIRIYDPTDVAKSIWDPNTGFAVSRETIDYTAQLFGYSETVNWIVRKNKNRRSLRGLYYLPELMELHNLWQSTSIDITIKLHNGNEIQVRRNFNIPI